MDTPRIDSKPSARLNTGKVVNLLDHKPIKAKLVDIPVLVAGLAKTGRLPVTTVIVNYNSGDLLQQSVAACVDDSQDVVVVDNGSTDCSTDPIKSTYFGKDYVSVVDNRNNHGFASGCNRGNIEATSPYVLFLNPDCMLAAGSLKKLVDALEANPGAAMAGGRLMNPDGTEQAGGRRAIPTPWRSFVRAFGLTRFSKRWPRLFYDFYLHTQPLPTHPVEVEAISGAMMLVRKSVLEEIGGWDENYFLHCEDLDICMRLRQKGWKILFVPDAPAKHFQGSCGRSRPLFVEWHKHKGMMRFYRKFFRHQYPGAFMWLVSCGVWLRFGMVATCQLARRIRHGGRIGST
ncbi:MAG: glycosyltransferase family 2 protein [Gammaproteobacteria bacterium]|nr:glycosyltransferase family 2 protein [Gammaproteobacteria bacterium]